MGWRRIPPPLTKGKRAGLAGGRWVPLCGVCTADTLTSFIVQLRRFRLTRGRDSMARHYSTREFFRQIPNALLARYFQRRGLFGDLDFPAMKETQPGELFAAWPYLPDGQRNEMDAEFRDIFELSCEKGFSGDHRRGGGALDDRPRRAHGIRRKSRNAVQPLRTGNGHLPGPQPVLEGCNPLLSRRHAALLAQAQESAAPTGGG